MAKKKTSKRSAASGEHHLDGSRVREARERKKLRMIDVYRDTEIPISTQSRIEAGMTEVRSDTLVRLCRALDVSADWLLGMSNSRERRP